MRMKHFTYGIVCCLLAITAVGQMNKAEKQYTKHYYKGVERYDAKKYKQAAKSFEKAHKAMPSDTNAILNAAYAAIYLGDRKRSIKNLQLAIQTGARDKTVFLRLYNHAVEADNLELALTSLGQALAIHPGNVQLRKLKVNVLIKQERLGVAKTMIQDLLVNEPDNPDLYFSLGVLAEQEGDVEGAMKHYQQAIQVDPDHYNSNFNIAVAIFNSCTELIKERNALSYREFERLKTLDAAVDEQLRLSMPLFEKLYVLDPKEIKVVETLAYIYNVLEMPQKAERMARELEALKR